MAKSKAQKQEEALARKKANMLQRMNTVLLFSPMTTVWRPGDTEDLGFFIDAFDRLRAAAKECGLHYDGTETYSTCESWNTTDLIRHLVASDEYLTLHSTMVARLEAAGQEVYRMAPLTAWGVRKKNVLHLLDLITTPTK